jgi:hypothetical protein
MSNVESSADLDGQAATWVCFRPKAGPSHLLAGSLESVTMPCLGKRLGYKQIVRNAGSHTTAQIGKETDTVTCYVYNSSDENICVVYDVYPVWNFSQPARGTVTHFVRGKAGRAIAWAFPSQQASMQCKLVSARYMPLNGLCQYQFIHSYGTTG